MGVLAETTILLHRYPVTFLAVGAAVALAAPVCAVAMAGALRPLARQVLGGALAARRAARQIAAESREALGDLVAEIESEEGVREESIVRPARVESPVQSVQSPMSAAS